MSEPVLALFSESNIFWAVKVFQLFVLALFILFAVLTIRQTDLMNRSVLTPIHFEVRLIAYLQLFLTIGIFVIVLVR